MMTAAVLLILNFALPRWMPGDAFLILSGEDQSIAVAFSEQQRQHYLAYYGLDRPLAHQFFQYLAGLARGDLGRSYHYREPVVDLILSRLPWTLFVGSAAFVLSIGFGIALGSISAWRRGETVDRVLYFVLVASGQIPGFLSGLLLLMLFAVTLGWFPLSGAATPFREWSGAAGRYLDILHHAALPVLTLALARTGNTYMLVRSSLASVLTRDYVITARAKGLRSRRVRYVHALRNALLPLITRAALQLGGLLGGAVLVENVFAYPGLGLLLQDAVLYRDYPLLQGILLFMSAAVLLANFAADRLYVRLDPRITMDRTTGPLVPGTTAAGKEGTYE